MRQARHLTLRDVAERAGVTESFLSQVERDVTSPSIASVQRIARALDLSIAQLFAEEGDTGRVVRREARRRVAYQGLAGGRRIPHVEHVRPAAGDHVDDRAGRRDRSRSIYP